MPILLRLGRLFGRAYARAAPSLFHALLSVFVPLAAARSQAVSVTPDGGTTTVSPQSVLSYNFTVQNTGATSTSYSLAVRCVPPLSSCSTGLPFGITLAGGASTPLGRKARRVARQA